jgi:spermidine/putrescine transport system permease protein
MRDDLAFRTHRRRLRYVTPYALLAPAIAFLAVALLLPAASLFDQSLSGVRDYGVVRDRSFDAYVEAVSTPRYREALLTSLALSVPAALLSVALAYPMAYFLAFRAGRLRGLLLFAIVVSTFTSFIVRVYAWRIILGDAGIINQSLERLGLIDEPLRFLIYSRWAVMITWLSVFVPLTVLILTASMLTIRPELLENARDLGAGTLRAFTRVILPLTMPAAVASFTVVLIFATSDFVTPDQLGGNIQFLGGYIADQFFLPSGDRPVASALAFILMAIFGATYLVLSRLERFKGF